MAGLFGSGIANAITSAGNALVFGQEYQQGQADLQIKKEQAAMGQLALQNAQRQQQTQQAVGAFLSSEIANDNSVATDPLKLAQAYQKGAGVALAGGDFVTANELGDLARGKLTEAKEAAVTLMQQKHQKDEAFATAADDYASNPTPDGYKAMTRAAVDAGRNPSDIPLPGTPQMEAYLSNARRAGMDSKSRAQLVEKHQEFDARQRQQKEEFAQKEQRLQEQKRQTAILKESMIDAKRANAGRAPKTINTPQGIYEDNPDMTLQGDRDLGDPRYVKIAGPRQPFQMQQATTALAGAAAQVATELDNISSFPLGTTSGPFTNLSDHGALDAVAKAGSNAFTPETVQMFQTSGAGLALQVGRVETLGAGRGVNQAQINQLERQLTPATGDEPMEQIYKVSTSANLVAVRMRNNPPPSDPALRKEWDDTLKQLSSYPKPKEVLNAATSEQRRKLLDFDHTYQDLLHSVQSDVAAHPATPSGGGGEGLPGTPDTGAGTNVPPLPAGGALPTPPANIQSLLDKYK